MIRRIELVNFMSHARTVIEPADGLTVLVGPNNCGKSAVVAALQILCHNDNSTYVTRHNERECTVTVETSDGHVVEWRRRVSPLYFVNGREFSRLERGVVPDEVQIALRLPKVTADGSREFDVHIGEQKSPVFLLDKPGSHAAQFFASSSDTASLVEMQRRHQQKMLDARKERIRLEADAERLARDLAVLSGADPIGSRIQGAETQHTALAQLSSAISQITDDARVLAQAGATLNQHDAEAGTLAPLRAPPLLEPIEPLTQAIEQLVQTTAELASQMATVGSLVRLLPGPALADVQPLARLIDELRSARLASQRSGAECLAAKGLQAPPPMEDEESLREVVRELAATGQKMANMQGRTRALEGLAAPPELVNEAGLTDDLNMLRRAVAAFERAEATHHGLAALAPPAALADATEIAQLITDMRGVLTTIDSHDRSMTQADGELRQAEHALRRWAEDNRICPTCGGTLDPARVAEHARTHLGGPPHA